MESHLNIQIGGKSLRLPNDFSLDIDEQNPLFHDTEMFSYPVQIPLEGNRSVIKNVDDINSDVRAVALEHQQVRIGVDGFPFNSGTAVIQEDEEVVDSVSMNVDASDQSFSDLIGDLKCTDIPVKDEIVIGEKIGNVHVIANYTFEVKADIKKHKDWHFKKSGNECSGTFEPQALGFSYPAVCETTGSRYEAKQSSVRSYPNNKSVIVPKVTKSYINTSAAYGETMSNGNPAYYANARVCYKHMALADDGTTSSNQIAYKDSKHQYEDIYPYWVLDADRPQSGICFYVLYFLDCLFAYLGVSFDKRALMAVGDFKRLVFFTTKCAYTTRKATQYKNVSNSNYHFHSLDTINKWLYSRGCGGQLEVEDPETKTVDDFLYTSASGSVTHYEVGKDNCRSITIKAWYDSTPLVRADILEMLASSDNFPDESVSSVLESLESAFGIKFNYDYEAKKVTAYLLRDVFRKKDTDVARTFNGKVYEIHPVSEKILGFRMKYSQESDSTEQLANIKDGVKDYDTDYDYIDYPQDKTITNKVYKDFFSLLSASDQNVYVDLSTGNAYRIKVDSDAKTANDLHPVLFEVGGYKGVELGDCSKQNEDFIEERTISFQPVIFNDVNYDQEKNSLGTSVRVTDNEGGTIGDFNSNVSSVLAAFTDTDMEHEFIEQKIRNSLSDYYINLYFTEKLQLVESYDPSSTKDGNSPLQEKDWGVALAVMRGGGANMDVQDYDFNYDTFGTAKWRTVAGKYAMASDCIDQFGKDYDYNGNLSGIGDEERFSLKIRAYKQPSWASNPLCNSDEVNADTHAITRKVRSRGLFDSFISEYAYFVLNRKKFKIRVLATPAQLADIRNHWRDQWNIGGKVGYIDKVSYTLSNSEGVKDIEIDFFCL